MHYRVYLLDQDSHIGAAETFAASCDADASAIAASVHQACADAFPRFELWRGPQRLQAKDDWTVEDVVARHQDSVLDLEERLMRTFDCLKRSRTLLEETTRLRSRWPV